MPKKIIKKALEEVEETAKKTVKQVVGEPGKMAETAAKQLGVKAEPGVEQPGQMTQQQLDELKKRKKAAAAKRIKQLEEEMAEEVKKAKVKEAPKETTEEPEEEKIPEPPVTPTKRRRGWFPQLPFSARQKMGTGETRRGVHG